jgi:hypothetical protein
LETYCKVNGSIATLQELFDRSTGTITDFMATERFAKANAIAPGKGQLNDRSIAVDRRQDNVWILHFPFLAQYFTGGEVEGDSVAIAAGHDNDVVAMEPPEILPSLYRTGLSSFAARNHLDAVLLGIGAQASLRVALRHGDRRRALPIHRLAPNAFQRRVALDGIGSRSERAPSGHRSQLAAIAEKQYFCH